LGPLFFPNSILGWDHGVFIPFLLINPAADIPIIQVSILAAQDPPSHFRMGAALSHLRASNIAIVGSGFASFHNLGILRYLRAGGTAAHGAFKTRSDEWNAALSDAVGSATRTERLRKLERWRELPNSFEMHPPGGADHFMPLLVCAGAVGDEEVRSYRDEWMGIDIWTYFWGADPVE